jgi:MoxR-like ATPase
VSTTTSETTTPASGVTPMTADEFREAGDAIRRAMNGVIDGKPDAVDIALTVLLAEGHLLIEDVPGVGKTVLARALARCVDGRVSRIQFTPDLLPADITGVSVYRQQTGTFEFTPGPVFAHIVIGDEINRASPKTQSALLECMEEGQVTVDGRTHTLAKPFLVVATQNPIEMEGTYALPEAQRDRFMARISIGYPAVDDEQRMLRDRERVSPLDELRPVVDIPGLARMIATVREVYVSPAVERYAVLIAQATRDDTALRLGASPRSTLQLVRAARARAALDGRDFVVPDDIDALATTVLSHRVILVPRAQHPDGRPVGHVDEVIDRIVATTPVPVPASDD